LGGGTIYGDAFIAKFNSTGVPQWSTYYGGSNDDNGKSIATDSIGNVVISGFTSSSDFPVLGGYQMTYGGERKHLFGDAFVVKFNSSGTRQWATYYGGPEDDWSWGVATDMKSNVYLLMEAEDTVSAIPPDVCSYNPIFNGGSLTDPYGGLPEDQLIVKFNPSGKKLCSTYVGGPGEDDLDDGGGITISGNTLYITGSTDGGYPVTAGAFQSTYGGGSGYEDIFVTSLCTNICEGKTVGLNFSANKTSVCGNLPITFSPTITNSCDTSEYSFQWTFPGGSPASSTISSPIVSYNVAGSYGVKLILATPCQKDSLNIPSYINVTASGISVNTSSLPDTCSKVNGIATANASGGSGAYTYNWSNGVSGQTASSLTGGTYSVTVSDAAGCAQTQSVSVIQIPGPTATVTSALTSITKGSSTTLTATGGVKYLWKPDTAMTCNTCPVTAASPLQTTYYCVLVTDTNNCMDTACVNINVENTCNVFVPSAFSPNEDGRNDILYVRSLNCITQMHLQIFDRWGELVFETFNPETGWDGTFMGKHESMGVFVYYLTGTMLEGTTFEKKGNVTLVR